MKKTSLATIPTDSAERSYATLEGKPWGRILAEDGFDFSPPITVHLPIQPVHSPDFVHVDAGLNVCRKRVFANPHGAGGETPAAQRELFVVQFALDDPPFIPDFRRATMRLEEGRFPIAHADYFAYDLYYRFEYFCRRIDGSQTLLWIRGEVCNEHDQPQRAHVRAKVNFQRECDLYDYHYVPFYWDRSKWPACETVRLEGDRILRQGLQIGKVVAGDFEVSWDERARFEPDLYNRSSRFSTMQPYFVTPPLQLNDLDPVIHFHAALDPWERKSFALALLVDIEGADDSHRQALRRARREPDRDATLAHIKGQFSESHTRLRCPVHHLDDRFTAFQISTLQLLVEFAEGGVLMPTQGGSSERHFVWVWEAMYMLVPMLKLGHFEPVKRALGFIFSLQDGGCPPQGRFTSLEGAIGTTGPRWINSTGSALGLAAEYWRYSKDERFLDTYLPKIIRAANWIVRELRATRQLNPDGTRPPYYGLLPFGCGTDYDTGYVVSQSDGFTFWGLEKTVLLLEAIGDTRASELRGELEAYRRDIEQVLDVLTREDGFIDRKLRIDPEEKIERKLKRCGSSLRMITTGCADLEHPRWARFLRYIEANWVDGYFAGTLDRENKYMGTAEFVRQYAYLARGEWKKAFAATRTNFKYGMTQDTYQVQERFSTREPAYTCWQPNGSGNGRALEMLLRSFWFEYQGVTTLLGGLPFAWLVANGVTALRGLYTPAGRVSLEIEAAADGATCSVTLIARDDGAMPERVRFPDFLKVAGRTVGVADLSGGCFAIPESIPQAVFSVAENADPVRTGPARRKEDS